MQAIINDLASPGLAPALEANMAAFWSAYGRGSGCTLHAAGGAAWFYTGLPVPLFNGVVLARFKEAEVLPTIESLRAEIAERRAPALWWLGPSSTPANLGALLRQHGLQPAGQAPGMAVDLALLNSAPPAVEGLVIQKVDSPDLQALWARTAAVGSEFPEAAEDMARLETSLTDAQYKAQLRLIGYLDGVAVASSAMVLDAGVAGIYAVATLPQARRKGIGQAMTVAPLLEARQMGYRVGILQASAMGYPIYQRIGFQDVCKFNLYFQSN